MIKRIMAIFKPTIYKELYKEKLDDIARLELKLKKERESYKKLRDRYFELEKTSKTYSDRRNFLADKVIGLKWELEKLTKEATDE